MLYLKQILLCYSLEKKLNNSEPSIKSLRKIIKRSNYFDISIPSNNIMKHVRSKFLLAPLYSLLKKFGRKDFW